MDMRTFPQYNNKYRYSCSRLTLAKLGAQDVEFIKVSNNHDLRNKHISAGTVQPGEYILLVEIQWEGNYTRNYNVNSYSAGNIQLALLS